MIAALVAAAMFCAHDDVRAFSVGNKDNRVTLSGDDAPRVVVLERIGGDAWKGGIDETLIPSVIVDGVDKPLHWNFDAKASRSDSKSATLVYDNAEPPLQLSWEWTARAAHGPLEHTIHIKNRSSREVWLPLQDSLRFRWSVPAAQSLQEVWIDKGGGDAPPIGTHVVSIDEGYSWRGTSSPFAHPRTDEAREIIPYFFVRATDKPTGWYTGIEFSGRVAMSLVRHDDVVEGTIGLNAEPAPFRTRVAPGATFATPTVFLGASDGDIDNTANTLQRWVREVLNDPATVRDPAYPLVTNNSWGSEMAIGEAQAQRMMDDAHRLGFEMFHVDAGWFRNVGDWRSDPIKSSRMALPRSPIARTDSACASDCGPTGRRPAPVHRPALCAWTIRTCGHG